MAKGSSARTLASLPVQCPVKMRNDIKPSTKATSKARAQANIRATLPVLEPSDAAAPSEQSQPPANAPEKTFAGRYPPSQPDRRVAWMNMVKDYEKKKEEDKKNCIK